MYQGGLRELKRRGFGLVRTYLLLARLQSLRATGAPDLVSSSVFLLGAPSNLRLLSGLYNLPSDLSVLSDLDRPSFFDLRLFFLISSNRLNLEPSFSPTQQEAHVTLIRLLISCPRQLVP
jgi:hypothetical protein